MIVKLVLVELWALLQLAALGWATRSVRWRDLVAGLLLPVVAVYWAFAYFRRPRGTTDLVLAGAAVGAGIGLAPVLLRFARDSQADVPDVVFTFLGRHASGSLHLCLVGGAVAGLGLALILRPTTGRSEWLGAGLILLVGPAYLVHHAEQTSRLPDALRPLVIRAELLAWVYPLIALAVAMWRDRRILEPGLRAEPRLRLAVEDGDDPSTAGLTRLALGRLPGSAIAVSDFIRLRRAYLYRRGTRSASRLRTEVERRVRALNQANAQEDELVSSAATGSDPERTGVEQQADYDSFKQAWEAARASSGLGPGAVELVQRLGPYQGRVTGRQSPDGRRGWRIDYDGSNGFHLSWWNRPPGTRRDCWRYGVNRVVDGTENDYWQLLQYLPGG